MTYHLGQIVPFDYPRRPLGAELASPQWFILTTPPQREASAKAWLTQVGVAEVWFPTEAAWRPVRGKRAKVEYQRLVAPGYVFGLFERAPAWDVVFQMGKGRVSGVVGRDGEPLAISVRALEQMQQVPGRIERERRLVEEARRIVPGRKVAITTGPLAGHVVDVTTVHAGIARIVLTALGSEREVEAPLSILRVVGG